ncbi:MAG: hypothetical protein J0J10_26225 [Bosea sp.]|uniref:hypothetical protein n=1 Tax=Bosea sp. (in: a-proteobacteria) TaxID=1871050 RepID=UPI001AC3E916|nr:hypothetical protein [Bosea sp. (in: a-proteobacteria)]MBN9472263.1 hypothetical protein [Bosea sp. (in: a-proteobacteria)]
MAGSDLVISVGASIKDLERQMKAASKLAEQQADEIEAKFRRTNPSFGGDFGLGVLKGAVAAFSLDKIIKGFAAANAEIASFADTARRAGLDLQRFQELRLAAQNEGIEGKAFDKGIGALAKELNAARSEETELGKLLEANNLSLRNRRGEVVSVNEALAMAADLISRAATEQDRVQIAEKFKLPDDFVPLLEGGAEAMNSLAQKAREAGGVVDDEVIRRAKDFDTAWNTAWNGFAASSKAVLVEVALDLKRLIDQAIEFRQRMINAGKAGAAFGELMGNEIQGKPQPTPQGGTPTTAPIPPSRPGRGYIGSNTTVIPTGKKSGGGGGGGGSGAKSEDEQAQDRLDRYIESLVRQRAVMEAEIATVGKSNAERKAAVEIARAQVDLEKLGTAAKAEYIAKLTEEVGKNEEVRASKERLQQAQQGLNDAQKYFGNAAVDALEDLIINGEKAEDVVKRLAASLAKAALQALLIGEGPLAGLFGMKGVGGGAGGLLGGIKLAGGGYVSGPGTGRSDSIPARLSNGEYVINARATKQNRALLEAINSGKLPAFADGGLVGRLPSVPASIARGSGGPSFSYAPVIDARGSQMSEAQFRAILSENNAALKAEMPGYLGKLQQRGGT